MAITYVGNGRYIALAADTKPTTAATNAELWETDTGKTWRYNGTTWQPVYVKNPASMVIFQEGSTTYAQEADGSIVSSSSTDASVPINYAISNIPGADTRIYAGRVYLYPGFYDCKTEIAMDAIAEGWGGGGGGVELVGEGFATQLRFTPSSALTNGIRIKMTRPRLANLMIYGNSDVTNLVRVVGPGAPARSDGGIVEAVHFHGANSNLVSPDATIDTVVSGQTGFLKDATVSGSTFGWRVHNCEFWGLDIGIYAKGTQSTTTFYDNLRFHYCTYGAKINNGENSLSNWYGTGGQVGRYMVHLVSDGNGNGTGNLLTNIRGELYIANQECAVVLIDQGSTANRLQNIKMNNAGRSFDSQYWFDVVNKNVIINNEYFDIAQLPNPREVGKKVGWWLPGHQSAGNEVGILQGNVAYSNTGSGLVNLATLNGPITRLATGSSANTVTSWRYNNPVGNVISFAYDPTFFFRFIANANSNLRLFIGLWNSFTAPTTTSDILNAKKGVGLWVDTAVTTQWKVMHNDGTGASSITAISGNPTIATATVYNVDIEFYRHSLNPFGSQPTPPGTVKANVTINGNRTTVSTDLPGYTLTDLAGFLVSMENTAAQNNTLDAIAMQMGCDF